MVTGLGRESALEIQKISTEQMYINHVFPVFYKFSEDERLKHFETHQRPSFLEDNILNLDSGSWHENQVAHSFLSELRNLRCLGSDGEPLRCANEVCNHKKIISTTFAEHFCFLSQLFTSSEHECDEIFPCNWTEGVHY